MRGCRLFFIMKTSPLRDKGEEMSRFLDVENQLAGRKGQALISRRGREGRKVRFFLAESDRGVARNGGRRGARFAPRAILHCLGKMAPHTPLSWQSHPISDGPGEEIDFVKAQGESTRMMADLLEDFRLEGLPVAPIFHLGGGHPTISTPSSRPWKNPVQKGL